MFIKVICFQKHHEIGYLTLKAIGRNLIAFAFLLNFISNPLKQDLTLMCRWHHTTFQKLEWIKTYRKLIIQKEAEICTRS